jgi:hypothetical protein
MQQTLYYRFYHIRFLLISLVYQGFHNIGATKPNIVKTCQGDFLITPFLENGSVCVVKINGTDLGSNLT